MAGDAVRAAPSPQGRDGADRAADAARCSTPLDEEAVRAAARELREDGVEAVAVCFLFSYLNPAHERRAAEIVREEMPDAFVTTSADIFPQFREFERFTTAAMNAFVGPETGQLPRAARDARCAAEGVAGELHVMMSNGGVASVAQAAERPVTLLLSGPAAGVLGGQWAGALAGRRRLITFDMGGTSADIGIVTEAGVSEASARDTRIARLPAARRRCSTSTTIGAGGGSIAYVDEGGAFRVGPRSAGAAPGPACYGHGGDGADDHRRPPRPRAPRPGALPRRRDDARPRRGRARRSSGSPSSSASACSRPPQGILDDRERQHGADDPLAHGREAATTRASSRSSPSAAPGRCTRPRSPTCSGSPEVLVPPHPGHHVRRPAC